MQVLRPFINILLFVAFLLFFGRNSIEKFLKGDVIINRNVAEAFNISQPGIDFSSLAITETSTFYTDVLVIPDDPQTSSGWKHNATSFMECVELPLEDYKTCLKSKGYSFEETILSYNGQINQKTKFGRSGPEHVLRLESGQIKASSRGNKFQLLLNSSLSYHIALVDPHFQVTNVNPAATPKTYVKIGLKKTTWIFLKAIIFSS